MRQRKSFAVQFRHVLWAAGATTPYNCLEDKKFAIEIIYSIWDCFDKRAELKIEIYDGEHKCRSSNKCSVLNWWRYNSHKEN